jgi:hypothetical protein
MAPADKPGYFVSMEKLKSYLPANWMRSDRSELRP